MAVLRRRQVLPRRTVVATLILAAVLLAQPQDCREVIESLDPQDFASARHRLIFQAMRVLWNDGAPIDTITVVDVLIQQGQLSQAGGEGYIDQLVHPFPGDCDLADAKIIRERRQ